MATRVTYPNAGLYEGGKPRYEVYTYDYAKPEGQREVISFCREATAEEAMQQNMIDAMAENNAEMMRLQQSIRDLATYGVRLNK